MSTSTIRLPVGARSRRGWGVSRLRAYFWSDHRRAVQTVLGLIWLLDGCLQFQSYMYSKGFLQDLAGSAMGQPGWLAGSIGWGVRLAGGDLILWNTLFALTQVAIGLGLLSRRTVKPALPRDHGAPTGPGAVAARDLPRHGEPGAHANRSPVRSDPLREPGGDMFYINGLYFDPTKITFHARLNTVEQWFVVNSTDEIHVFHMHTYPMQVLSVNGVPAPFNGYQDEVDIPPNGYAVLRFHFTGYTGVTVFHCHILAHEDMGMMANIEVTK